MYSLFLCEHFAFMNNKTLDTQKLELQYTYYLVFILHFTDFQYIDIFNKIIILSIFMYFHNSYFF